MLVELSDQSPLYFSAVHFLSHKVSVPLSILSTESIGLLLKVICLHMRQNCRSHVSVILARSDSVEHHRASILLALSTNCPAGKDDKCKVAAK